MILSEICIINLWLEFINLQKICPKIIKFTFFKVGWILLQTNASVGTTTLILQKIFFKIYKEFINSHLRALCLSILNLKFTFFKKYSSYFKLMHVTVVPTFISQKIFFKIYEVFINSHLQALCLPILTLKFTFFKRYSFYFKLTYVPVT